VGFFYGQLFVRQPQLRQLFPAAWTAEVIQVDHRAENIAVLTIAPDQPLPFRAGQHLTVQTPRWPQVWRPFSIACMPRDDGLLTLHVKAVPGGWVSTALVHHTPPGAELVLGPALGTMTLDRAAGRDLLCVAGGTGLAPIKAIIEQAVRESAATPRRITCTTGHGGGTSFMICPTCGGWKMPTTASS
jgi:ferredoxin-NADP reductase